MYLQPWRAVAAGENKCSLKIQHRRNRFSFVNRVRPPLPVIPTLIILPRIRSSQW